MVQAFQLPHWPPTDDPQASPPGSGRQIMEDKLYLHRHAQLSPQFLLNTTPTTNRNTVLVNGQIEFTLQQSLGTDVEVIGKDDKSGGVLKGMWLDFLLTGAPTTGVTITILQDNATVATGTTNFGASPTLSTWSVPFAAPETSHVFPAGSLIKVRIAPDRPATLTYNTTESYLLMPLSSPPVNPQIITSYGSARPTGEFHPYWPDSVRRIRTEGDIAAAFGPDDVARALVTIRSPTGDAVFNSTAQLSAGHYVGIWNYSKGQVPGNYNVSTTVTDRQGHEYVATSIVAMLRYAAYASSKSMDDSGVAKGAASPPRGGSEGTPAVYTLDILNSGYSDTSVTIRVSSEPPPGWTAVLSTTSLPSMAPGATTNITFTVSPSAEVEYGDKAVIYVEAVADADPRTPKASWTVQTVTNSTMSRNFEFSAVGPTEAWVDVGQTVSYQLLARNRGLLDMNLSFSVAGTPVGWTYLLDATGLVHLDTGPSSERTINLTVTAPPEEVGNLSRTAQITITAQALEDANLEKTVTTVTHLITILGLAVTPQVQTSDLDVLQGKADFKVTINNLDPMNSHQVRLTLTAPGDWPLSSLKYDPKESLLSPNGTTTITASITPPGTALANEATGYPITVKVEPLDQPSRSNTTAVTLKVRQKYGISLAASPETRDAKPGQKVSFTLKVKNLGNGNDTAIVYVSAGVPQDWEVRLNDALSPRSLSVPLAATGHAGDEVTINLTVKPSAGSANNAKVNISVTAKSPGSTEVSKGVTVTVKKDFWGPDGSLMDAIRDSSLIIILTFFVFGISALVYRRQKT